MKLRLKRLFFTLKFCQLNLSYPFHPRFFSGFPFGTSYFQPFYIQFQIDMNKLGLIGAQTVKILHQNVNLLFSNLKMKN